MLFLLCVQPNHSVIFLCCALWKRNALRMPALSGSCNRIDIVPPQHRMFSQTSEILVLCWYMFAPRCPKKVWFMILWYSCLLFMHLMRCQVKLADSTSAEEDHFGQETGIHPFCVLLFGKTGSVSGDSTEPTYLNLFIYLYNLDDLDISRCSCLRSVSVFTPWLSLTMCTSVFLVTRVATIFSGALRARQTGLESVSCTRHPELQRMTHVTWTREIDKT